MTVTNVVATASLIVRNPCFKREFLAIALDAQLDSAFLKQALVSRRYGVTLLVFNPTPKNSRLRIGRIICTGARSPGHARVALARFDMDLMRLFGGVRATGTKVFNQHSTGTFGKAVDKVGLFAARPDAVRLDSKFPAARVTFYVDERKIGAEVFQSGRFNIAGPRDARQIHKAVQTLVEIVGPHLVDGREPMEDELFDTRIIRQVLQL